MPCIINDRFDDLTPEEQAALFKATYWADNITEREWPVVLDHDDANKVHRSRLKKKGAGWLMALARIAHLNPELFRAMAEQACTMYVDQVEENFPWLDLVRRDRRAARAGRRSVRIVLTIPTSTTTTDPFARVSVGTLETCAQG